MCCSFGQAVFRTLSHRSRIKKRNFSPESRKASAFQSVSETMSPSTIVVIGSLNTDLVTITNRIPDPGETLEAKGYSEHYGGKGANTSIAAHRLSHYKPGRTPVTKPEAGISPHEDMTVRMIGRVGADDRGRSLIENLKANGVDASGVEEVSGVMTGVCVAIVESQESNSTAGENRLLFHAGANHSLKPENFKRVQDFGRVKPNLIILQLEIPTKTVVQILDCAHKNGVDTLLNPSPADYLLTDVYRTVTHLVLNETEAAQLRARPTDNLGDEQGWANIAANFIELGVQNVVITLGAKGAYFKNRHDQGHIQAQPDIKVKDTTGAG